MTRIRCWQTDCVFWLNGICNSGSIEYHPDHGCLTAETEDEFDEEEWKEDTFGEEDEEDWEEEDEFDEEDWEDFGEATWKAEPY